ncbi:MAG: hypothetical protein M1840_005177 [Geoglossum simile]|nr:MAG: hypothetical protein M1840_005177 [Geoglossum simile]
MPKSMKMRQFVPFFLALFSTALSKSLINYKGGQPVSILGTPQLEGQELGDKISDNTANVFIKLGEHPNGVPALWFHRDASFRRAEVKGAGDYLPDKTYVINYEFMLGSSYNKLAIFQWKKADKAALPVQNVPLNLQFVDDSLSLGYTAPGRGYAHIWTAKNTFELNKSHHIMLRFDTFSSHSNTLQMEIDGEEVFKQSGLDLWTGDTYPKFGIYRGEEAGDPSPDSAHTFDLWVYAVTVEQL